MRNFSEKSYLYYANIDKTEIFHALCDKVALLTNRCSERVTGNRHQIIFWKAWIMPIENVYQKIFMTSTKLRLDFLFTDLCQQSGIDLVFAIKFFIMGMGMRWRKVIYVVYLRAIQLQSKYKTRNFQNVLRKDCSETFIETKNKQESQSATWRDHRHHKHSWILCMCFFQFNNNLGIII